MLEQVGITERVGVTGEFAAMVGVLEGVDEVGRVAYDQVVSD